MHIQTSQYSEELTLCYFKQGGIGKNLCMHEAEPGNSVCRTYITRSVLAGGGGGGGGLSELPKHLPQPMGQQ